MEVLFHEMLNELCMVVPIGFAVHESEWDEDKGYPTLETIPMRGSKHLDIALPYEVWWPRAVHWAQALKLIGTGS